MTIDKYLPQYEAPSVVTYTDTDLLEELGPARTCVYAGECNGTPISGY